jgi:hypothetical protein
LQTVLYRAGTSYGLALALQQQTHLPANIRLSAVHATAAVYSTAAAAGMAATRDADQEAGTAHQTFPQVSCSKPQLALQLGALQVCQQQQQQQQQHQCQQPQQAPHKP